MVRRKTNKRKHMKHNRHESKKIKNKHIRNHTSIHIVHN